MKLIAKAADHVKSHPAFIAARQKIVSKDQKRDEL